MPTTSQASRQTPLERAEAALAVQRHATGVYQTALKRACTNLGMLGRGDVARSIADDVLKQAQAIPGLLSQLQETEDDDDLAG